MFATLSGMALTVAQIITLILQAAMLVVVAYFFVRKGS